MVTEVSVHRMGFFWDTFMVNFYYSEICGLDNSDVMLSPELYHKF